MYKLTSFLIILILLLSCQGNEDNLIEPIKIHDQIDTLYFTEAMRVNSGFNVKFDLDSNQHRVPREKWINVNLKPKGVFDSTFQNFEIYLTSSDSNLTIQRNSNLDYKFHITNEYKGDSFNGYLSETDDILQFEIRLQPSEGYVFKTYWREKPFTHKEKTRICLKSVQLESI